MHEKWSDNSTVIAENSVIMEDNRTTLKQPYATFMIEQFKNPVPRSCFPASATVELESGEIVRMDELKVGDRVAVADGKFSEVYLFTHKLAGVLHEFVSIVTEKGLRLRLTDGHYLLLNDGYKPASCAKIGDFVHLGDGTTSRTASVSRIIDNGLYNPHTMQGDIIVNGLLISTYTTAVAPRLAHALLSPLRFYTTLLRTEWSSV